MQTLCLFEDRTVANFYPIADTRHLSELLVGIETLRARASRRIPHDTLILHGRSFLDGQMRSPSIQSHTGRSPILFVNALCHVDDACATGLAADGEWIIRRNGRTVAARVGVERMRLLDMETGSSAFDTGLDLPERSTGEMVVHESIWDLIAANGETIVADMDGCAYAIHGMVDPSVRIAHRDRVMIAAGARIDPGAILDATEGPVVIDKDARVMHGAVLLGPVYIGAGTIVKVGAKIYPGTSIGPCSKVGGEVEGSIFIGYSNKQHDGFVGHSYLGTWVNLGADTNTSDLKNNYGTVRVSLQGREVDTGRMMLGSLIGDHVKTGINTMLNTGTVIGVGASVFGAGFPPKEIPRFAWGGFEGGERYRIDQAIAVARTVMSRRGVAMTSTDETLLRYLHGLGGNFGSTPSGA